MLLRLKFSLDFFTAILSYNSDLEYCTLYVKYYFLTKIYVQMCGLYLLYFGNLP